MKKKFGLTGKILSAALAFLIIIQAAPLTIAGLGAELGAGLGEKKADNTAAGNAVLPDADKGQWEIPEAQENPHNVDMTINNGIVYNDFVYSKLISWGYVMGYQGAGDPYKNGGWRDFTASLGPLVALSNYKWYNNNKGNWIDNSYVTTVVKRSNTEYGIYKNILTPTLTFGGKSFERAVITQESMRSATRLRPVISPSKRTVFICILLCQAD